MISREEFDRVKAEFPRMVQKRLEKLPPLDKAAFVVLQNLNFVGTLPKALQSEFMAFDQEWYGNKAQAKARFKRWAKADNSYHSEWCPYGLAAGHNLRYTPKQVLYFSPEQQHYVLNRVALTPLALLRLVFATKLGPRVGVVARGSWSELREGGRPSFL